MLIGQYFLNETLHFVSLCQHNLVDLIIFYWSCMDFALFFCHAKEMTQGFPLFLLLTKQQCSRKLERMCENEGKHSVQGFGSCFDPQKYPEDAGILVLHCSVAREHSVPRLLSACRVVSSAFPCSSFKSVSQFTTAFLPVV